MLCVNTRFNGVCGPSAGYLGILTNPPKCDEEASSVARPQQSSCASHNRRPLTMSWYFLRQLVSVTRFAAAIARTMLPARTSSRSATGIIRLRQPASVSRALAPTCPATALDAFFMSPKDRRLGGWPSRDSPARFKPCVRSCCSAFNIRSHDA